MGKRIGLLTAVIGVAFIGGSRGARADGPLDTASEEALRKTQQLLTTPGQREQVIGGYARAKQADAQVDALTGSNAVMKEQIYRAASGAMGDITNANGGDPDAMAKMLEKAQKDPEGFLNSLSPETQDQVRSIARDLEERQRQTKQPH